MKILGGDGVPKGEITDAPKGVPVVMNRHNRRKLMAQKMSRPARKERQHALQERRTA